MRPGFVFGWKKKGPPGKENNSKPNRVFWCVSFEPVATFTMVNYDILAIQCGDNGT